MSRAQLALALSYLPAFTDDRILVGTNTADDAGVIRIAPDRALAHTVDVFAPVVNDPYTFGRIAAVNSISDIYAMGGTPLAALNVVGFPGNLDVSVLGEMLRGGQDAALEAGVAMLGGHTFQNAEIRYGLAVMGEVHPDRIVTNSRAKAGGVLILTKPLGTGVVIQALASRGVVSESVYRAAVALMCESNRVASEVMRGCALACTDITGFGLAGHCWEMAEGSGVGAVIEAAKLPTLPQALELIRDGVVEAGVRQNRNSFEKYCRFGATLPDEYNTLVFSSETSGGLLIAAAPEKTDEMLRELNARRVKAVVVGYLTSDNPGTVSIY